MKVYYHLRGSLSRVSSITRQGIKAYN